MLFMHFSSKYVIQAYVILIFEYIWSLFLPPKKARQKYWLREWSLQLKCMCAGWPTGVFGFLLLFVQHWWNKLRFLSEAVWLFAVCVF